MKKEMLAPRIPDIIEQMFTIIQQRCGLPQSVVFLGYTIRYNQGNYFNIAHLSDQEQIAAANQFFRHLLIEFPNTTELRSWLCEGNDIAVYIDAFESHWLALLVDTGILSNPS